MIEITRIEPVRAAALAFEDNIVRADQNIVVTLPTSDGANVKPHRVVREPVPSNEFITRRISGDDVFLHGHDAFDLGHPHDLCRSLARTVSLCTFGRGVHQVQTLYWLAGKLWKTQLRHQN